MQRTTSRPIDEDAPVCKTGAVERTTICVRLILHRGAIAPASATSFCGRTGTLALFTELKLSRRKRRKRERPARSAWVAPNLCGNRRSKAPLSAKYGKWWNGCTSTDESHGSNGVFSDGRSAKHRRLSHLRDAVDAPRA